MVDGLLYLDSGNSRLKWRNHRGRGVFENDSELLTFINDNRVSQVVLATVTGVYTASSILSLAPHIAVHEIQVENNFLGLALAYADIAKLGVDRWLSMLALVGDSNDARQMVVSVGTAMTIDVIDIGGEHIGGYIVPGLRTQALSLSHRTADLPNTPIGDNTDLGRTTEQCISRGILRSCCALVEAVQVQYGSCRLTATITGGDGSYLSESLSIKNKYCEGLIFKGMQAYWEVHTAKLR